MKNILISLAIVVLSVSCTERIDISPGNHSPRLVVNAFISTEPSQQAVWLSKSVPYFGGTPIPAVTNAQVWIDGVLLTPNDTAPGQYITPAGFRGTAGQPCSLRVLYDLDGDGLQEEFTAQDTMRHDVSLDSLIIAVFGVDTGKYRPPFTISAKATRNVADDNFCIDMYYGNRNMSRSVSDFGAGSVPYGLYREKITFSITTGGTNRVMSVGDTMRLCPFDTIRIKLHSIPKIMLTYISSADRETGGRNPMFGGPPANVETNLRGGALGCFGLRNASGWRSIVLPMNVKTLDDTWNAKDGSGRQIAVSNGTATYANGADRGAVYFSGVQVDKNIRGFWAGKGGEFLSTPAQFKMVNYNEFEDLSTGVGWLREKKSFMN